ncbi:hypothetical protein QPK31_01415 [Massilia sp. YIM B02769]|uniref:hypothetical protein n=1 Tax=unclassified Massilia TaxID=2609279 RepID=UPI0025B6DA83|nr:MULTISPECIES: hypothetical protein [unclassified Massilia]MDN4056872.1 hypothetical protein [Massilia sp. YIM B02769]
MLTIAWLLALCSPSLLLCQQAIPGMEALFKVIFASKKRFTGSSSVEKPLDMHRIGCAKATFL